MGCFLVKKWTFPQSRVHYLQYQYFFVLHFTYLGGVRTQRNPCLRACCILIVPYGKVYQAVLRTVRLSVCPMLLAQKRCILELRLVGYDRTLT